MAEVVTFDCYRTLIDFDLEGATAAILGGRLQAGGVDRPGLMRDFAAMRFHAVLEDYRPYREILRRTLEHALRMHGIPARDGDGDALVESVRRFRPFPEVPDVLRRLKERYRIAIISNSDDDLMADNVAAIGVDFDHVITAQQARAYKPSKEAFAYALRVIGLPPSEIVHVAQGFDYDIIPTHGLGMRRIWVNRFARRGNEAYMPYEEIHDLSPLPDLLGISTFGS